MQLAIRHARIAAIRATNCTLPQHSTSISRSGYEATRTGLPVKFRLMCGVARELGVAICPLLAGQGVIINPLKDIPSDNAIRMTKMPSNSTTSGKFAVCNGKPGGN